MAQVKFTTGKLADEKKRGKLRKGGIARPKREPVVSIASHSFEQAFKNIDDVLWKEAGCTTELDYTEQTSWLLFLKYLDGLEQDKADEAALDGKKYTYILDKPYRW
jgi:HsdM N-terminal domain